MPAAEVVGELGVRALGHPGFHLPVVALDEGDEVHDLAAAHWIVQHVAVRAEPVDALHLTRGAAAAPSIGTRPRHATAPVKIRLVLLRTAPAGPGVNAVSADHIGGTAQSPPSSNLTSA